jgi:AcrR family transcriptional regulator
MTRPAKRRSYDSRSRRRAAFATRQGILDAARRLFLQHGYAAATMPAIARAAGIALDTVYAAVGRKPKLFRLLIEAAISGQPEAVPAEARDYVQAIRAEKDAAGKLRIYARALGRIQPRLAPLFHVLQSATGLEPGLKKLWTEIARRRAAGMRLLAEDLQATGRLRPGLSVAKAADILWSMNSPEFYLLLVAQRRWTAEEYQLWLGEAWIELLLSGETGSPGGE